MKVLFMGTPEFALPCLEMLIEENYNLVGVVTQPDRPKGRGKKLAQPPIKEYSVSKDIKVYQPEGLKNGELEDILQELEPEIIIVIAYGQILPSYMLEYPKYGCINVHASLLPKYRGAGPIQWSIINGEQTTGVTTMYMDEGMDTGDIILKKEVSIGCNETAGELHDKLSVLGKDLLKETLELIKSGTTPRESQDNTEATYAPMLDKNTGRIDWSRPALQIKNLIRGVNPWPGAYTKHKGKTIKIWSADVVNCESNVQPGTIVSYDDNKGLLVKAGDGKCLVVKEMQIQGRKRMDVHECLRGYPIESGEIYE